MIDRDKLQAVFLALLMIGSVVAMSAGTVAAAQPSSAADAAQSTLDNVESTSESIDSETTADDTGPSVSAPTQDVEISDGLREKKGEAVVLLSVERGLSREALASVDAEALKADSENTLRPVAQEVNSLEYARVQNQFWIGNVLSVKVDFSEHDVKELAAIDGVRSISPNVDVHLPTPVDPEETESASAESNHNGYTYGLQQIGIPSFEQKYGDRGGDATVTVIDDGVTNPDNIHPDLNFTMTGIAENGEVTTGTLGSAGGHGEHVAGTVSGAATPAGDVPRYGVAPNASVIMINAFEGGTLEDILAAVEFSVEQDSDVTTMSLGFGSTTGYSTVGNIVEDTVQDANAAGTLVTVSAGNSGSGDAGGPTTSPGAEFSSMAVGASNAQGNIASFSSGDVINPNRIELLSENGTYPEHYPREYVNPDVAAPGVQVLSTGDYGTVAATDPAYSYLSGTSMAAPHVAGAATLLQSMTEEDLDPKLIEMALVETAEKPSNDHPSQFGRDIRYGAGIINVTAAADALTSGSMAVDGTVTDTGGDPIQGASVHADSNALTSTNATGDYTLHTTQDEVDVTVDAFGYDASTQTVSSSSADFTLEDAMELDLVEGQRVYAEFGGYVNATVDVRNLENLTVSLTEETNVSQSDMTLLVNGQEATFGEPVELDRYNGTAEVRVELADGGDYAENQVIGLEHTFEGLGDSTTVETGPTKLTENLEPAFFDLTDIDAAGSIMAGEDLPITVNVTNTGQITATKDVQMTVSGASGSGSLPPSSYELQPGETMTVEISAGGVGGLFAPGQEIQAGFRSADSIEQGIFGGYTVTGLNDEISTPVALQAEGTQIEVASLDAPTEVDPGEEVVVNATIQNYGNESGEDTATFSFDGQTVDSQSVSLGAFSSASTDDTAEVSFTVTAPEESGVYTHTVATENDSMSASLGVGVSVPSVTVVSTNEFGQQTVSLLEQGLTLNEQPAQVNYASASEVDSETMASTDVFVFHDLEGVAGDVIPMVENDPATTAVYLEQFADSNAIAQRSEVIGDPVSATADFSIGGPPVEFTVTQDHPLFDGVAEEGESFVVHTSGDSDYVYFEGASGETLAESGLQGSAPAGPTAAVDPDSGSVLLATIAPNSYEPVSSFTDDAARVLANSVSVAQEGIVTDAVGSTSIDADFVGTVDDAEEVTVTAEDVVAGGELVDGEEITFTVGGEPVATSVIENGTATATFDPQTLDAPAGETLTVSVEEMTVIDAGEVETVHETLDLDEGYNLLSVPQAADLSADNVTAVNTWNTSGASYEMVTQSEFDSPSDLHQGLYVSGAADDARLGMTFSDDVPVGGTADLANGWTLTGSNFPIDSTEEMRDTRTLDEDLLEVDPSELSVFSSTFNQQYDGNSTIGAYEAYWAFNDEETSYERAIISPSYEVEDREDVLGIEDSEFEVEILNVETGDESLLESDEILGSNEQVVKVTAEVTNDGGLDTQFVDLNVSGEHVDRSLGVTLENDDSEIVSLYYTTAQEDVPEIDIEVSTEDNTATLTEDLDGGDFSVESQALTLDDEFVVSNVDFAGEANIEVASNDSVIGNATVESGVAEDVVIPVNASMIENGEVEVRLLNADGEQQTNATVDITETTIDVEVDDDQFAFADADSTQVEVDVYNNALIDQTATINFSADGETESSEVPVYGDDWTTTSFTVKTSDLSTGDTVNYTVNSPDDTDSGTLTVAESALTFDNQSVNADGEVLVEDVTASADQKVVVTDTDFNIAGQTEVGDINGENVTVDLDEAYSGAGQYIAHIVSTDTSDMADSSGLVYDKATIVEADVAVDDKMLDVDESQTAEVSEVTVSNADVVDADVDGTNFTVEIRQNGNVIGESDTLNGSNSGETVTLDTPITAEGETEIDAVLVDESGEAFQEPADDSLVDVSDSATVTINVSDLSANVALPNQEIGSYNGSDAVLVENVTGQQGQYVVITDSDLNVVGTHAIEGDVAAKDVVVQLDESVEPGEYRAHLTSDVQLVGDEGIVTDTGALYEADVAFEDQEFVGSTDEVEVQTADLMDGMGNSTTFAVAIHENGSASGDIIGTATGLTGENDDVTVSLDDGESIDEEGEYVAMLHFSADGTAGDAIPVVDDGSVSTITDNATITSIESAAAFDDQILTTTTDGTSATSASVSFSGQDVSDAGTVNVTDVTTNGAAAIFVIDGSQNVVGLTAIGEVSDESFEVNVDAAQMSSDSANLEAIVVGAFDVSDTGYAAGDQLSSQTYNSLLDNTGTQGVTNVSNASNGAGDLSGLAADGGADEVLVEDVQANQSSMIVVTYPNDGNLTIAGIGPTDFESTAPENVTVEIGDAGGFPGEHTAHVIPTDDLSTDYNVGDNVSAATAANATTNVSADVYDAQVDIADQTVEDGTEEVTVATANLYDDVEGESLVGDTEFMVELSADGEVIGTSDTLTANNSDVTVSVSEITATTDVTATIVDTSGNVPQAVGSSFAAFDDTATVTVQEATGGNVDFSSQAMGDDGEVVVENVQPVEPKEVTPEAGVEPQSDFLVLLDADDEIVDYKQFSEFADGADVMLNASSSSPGTHTVAIYEANESGAVRDTPSGGVNATATVYDGNVSITTEEIDETDEALDEVDVDTTLVGDNVEYNVTISGAASGSVTDVSGTDSVTVPLDSELSNGDTVTATLEVDGETVQKASGTSLVDLSDQQTVSVVSADFQLTDVFDLSGTYQQGADPVSVDYEVTNDGDATAAADVTLNVTNSDDETVIEQQRTTPFELSPGDSFGSSFNSVDFGALDPGTYTVAVETDDDTVSTEITVDGSTYNVDSLDIAGEGNDTTLVEDASPFEITANVENVGNLAGADGAQDLVLNITDANGDDVYNATNEGVEVGTESSSTTSFSGIDPTDDLGGPGDYTVTISSDDDSVSGDLTVRELGFEMQSTSVVGSNTIDRSTDTIDVQYTVENQGDSQDIQDIVLEIRNSSGTVVVTETDADLTLPTSSSTTQTISGVDVSSLATGEYDIVVSSEDSQTSDTLTVEATEGDLTITADDPGISGTENNVTFTFGAGAIDDDTDTGELLVDFDESSNVDTSDIGIDDVNVTFAGDSTSLAGVQENNAGELLITLSDSTTLQNIDGDIVVEVEGVTPDAGTHDGSFQVHDDASDDIASGTGSYVIEEDAAPSVSIDTPNDGDTVQSQDTISGTASDDLGVTSVELTIEDGEGNTWNESEGAFTSDATSIEVATSGGDWSYDSSSIASDGTYTVTATATDTADQSTDDSVSYTIDTQVETTSLTATNDNAQEITVTVEADEQLSALSASDGSGNSVSGVGDGGAFTETANQDGTYTYVATYDAGSDGDYTVTLDSASDTNSNTDSDPGLSDSVTVDTTAPSISGFSVENTQGQTVQVSFDSDEQLNAVTVSGGDDASGTTLDLGDFTETEDQGTYTYTAELSSGSDGTFSATLDTAEDAAGNDGASSQSDSATVDTQVETTSLTATNDNAQEITVTVEADEQLSALSASDGSGNSVSGIGGSGAFTETANQDGTYTYVATYDAGSAGDYTVTLDSASDTNGNTDNDPGLSDTVTVS